MSNPALLADEDFIADCLEAALPDEAFITWRECDYGGEFVPEGEGEKIAGAFICFKHIAAHPEFVDGLIHIEAVLAKSDGGRA